MLSWDIGGGSIQLTGVDAKDHQVLGGTVASSTFQKMATDSLGGASSIYPLDARGVQNIIDLAKERLDFGVQKKAWFADKKAQAGVEIIGVGNNP